MPTEQTTYEECGSLVVAIFTILSLTTALRLANPGSNFFRLLGIVAGFFFFICGVVYLLRREG